MVPDVIEDDQQHTGQRREGAFYSLVAFFQKLGTGLALWGIGQALSASGYVTPSDADPFPLQPAAVLRTLRFLIGPATVALLLLSLPVAWRYPIRRDSHRKMREALRAAGSDTAAQKMLYNSKRDPR